MNRISSFLIVTILAFAWTACGSGGGDQEQKTEDSISTDMIENSGDEASPKPDFKFEKTTHDFGEITEGEKVNHTFKFTNSGSKPLVISDANASCGCTVPNYPKKPIKPGETGLIDVEFNSDNKPGKFNKSVTLVANTDPNTHKIHIKGVVNKKQ